MKAEEQTNQQNQPIADDAALAQALAGISNAGDVTSNNPSDGLQFEEAPLPTPIATPAQADSVTESTEPEVSAPPTPIQEPTPPEPVAPVTAETPELEPIIAPLGSPSSSIGPISPTSSSAQEASATPAPATSPSPVTSGSPLESVKQGALSDLRPLVDKLSLPNDERFDTLLLIIRSTDDQSLVPSAYQAARAIEDETKRAQALLDVIKEIDFFSSQGK